MKGEKILTLFLIKLASQVPVQNECSEPATLEKLLRCMTGGSQEMERYDNYKRLNLIPIQKQR